MIRAGWVNRETGKAGAPRMQYLHFEILQNTIVGDVRALLLEHK